MFTPSQPTIHSGGPFQNYRGPCKACGAQVNGRLCSVCGADQAVLLQLMDVRLASDHARTEQARTRSQILALIGLVVMLALAGALALFFYILLRQEGIRL